MPREVHEQQDADGKTVGWVVVHRESAWDEAQLDRVQRVQEYLDGLCPCGCGVSIEKAWDPFFEPWSVDHYVCYASRARERVEKQWHEQHKGQGEGYAVGVRFYVTAPPEGEHNEVAAAKAEQIRARRRGSGD